MIVPTDYRVILTYEQIADVDPQFKKAKAAGLYLPEDHEDMQRKQVGIDKGNVVAIGPNADFGFEVKVGERVGFAKHSGKVIEDESTKTKYIILNDEDVLYVQRGE